MPDAGCYLELPIVIGLPSEPDAATGAALLRRALELLTEHAIGPASWTPGLGELGWPSVAALHQGAWGARRVRARLSASDATLHLTLGWELELPVERFCEPLAGYVRALVGAMPAGGHVLSVASLRPQLDLVHRAPPPDHRSVWTYGSLLDVLDAAAPTWNNEPPAGYDAQLPPPARRDVDGTMHMLRWANDPLTRDEIQRAVLAQERWQVAHFETRDREDWNALGDRVVSLYDFESRAPLAYYEERSGTGYQPLDVGWDGTLDDHAFAKLVALRAAGRLPDGAELNRLGIICPTRRAAIALHPRAAAAGLGVAYSRAGATWDPRPDGYIHPPDVAEPHLEIDVRLELASDPTREHGTELLRRLPALLTKHRIGPAAWHLETDERPGEQRPLDELRWPQRPIHLRGDDPADPSILLSGRERCLEARIRWPWRDGMRLIDPLVALVEELHAGRPAGSHLVSDSFLVPVGLELASVRPPRERHRFRYGALLDIIDLDDQGWNEWPKLPPEFLEPLPEPAIRHVEGSLQVLQWAHDPLTHGELQRAWAMQQRWLTRTMQAELVDAERWNEQGDRSIVADLVAAPPLTFYDPETGAGYKVLVAGRDGAVNPTAFAELEALRGAGVLSDGRPLTSLTIITTSRESAVALAPRARVAGFQVAYGSGPAELWELRPEGWLDPE